MLVNIKMTLQLMERYKISDGRYDFTEIYTQHDNNSKFLHSDFLPKYFPGANPKMMVK